MVDKFDVLCQLMKYAMLGKLSKRNPELYQEYIQITQKNKYELAISFIEKIYQLILKKEEILNNPEDKSREELKDISTEHTGLDYIENKVVKIYLDKCFMGDTKENRQKCHDMNGASHFGGKNDYSIWSLGKETSLWNFEKDRDQLVQTIKQYFPKDYSKHLENIVHKFWLSCNNMKSYEETYWKCEKLGYLKKYAPYPWKSDYEWYEKNAREDLNSYYYPCLRTHFRISNLVWGSSPSTTQKKQTQKPETNTVQVEDISKEEADAFMTRGTEVS